MCQIIGLTNIKGLDKRQLNALALESQKLVSSQKDGFGFAYATKQRQTKEHSYYCEKYVNPYDFKGIGSVGYTKVHLNKLGDAIKMDMLSSGHPDAPEGGYIAHGRIATNNKTIANTHPFRKKGYAMVHNGVVDFDGIEKDLPELHKRYSSCDSEWLLNSYVFDKGHHAWQHFLTGYAATLTITSDNKFIAAKGDRASLYVGAVPKLNGGCLIFATKKDYISKIAQSIGYVATPAFSVKDNWACSVDSKGLVKVEKFSAMESFTAGTYHFNQANQAFGVSTKKGNNYSSQTSHTWTKGAKGYEKVEKKTPASKPTMEVELYGHGCGLEANEYIQ